MIRHSVLTYALATLLPLGPGIGACGSAPSSPTAARGAEAQAFGIRAYAIDAHEELSITLLGPADQRLGEIVLSQSASSKLNARASLDPAMGSVEFELAEPALFRAFYPASMEGVSARRAVLTAIAVIEDAALSPALDAFQRAHSSDALGSKHSALSSYFCRIVDGTCVSFTSSTICCSSGACFWPLNGSGC
jgi:hypothetical protein